MSTILVCDDEKDIVSALEIYLKSEGYSTIPVHAGLDAIECVREKSIDLVLLDIMMPKIDGFGVCELIRKVSDVPVILYLKGTSTATKRIKQKKSSSENNANSGNNAIGRKNSKKFFLSLKPLIIKRFEEIYQWKKKGRILSYFFTKSSPLISSL